MTKALFLAPFLLIALFGDSYVTPAEYDNLREGHRSAGYGVLTNTTGSLSANSYVIGGQTVKYRCLVVPKIDCRAAVPSIIPNVSEVSVREESTNEVVNVYTTDVRVEDTANDWYLCGAAYAGATADHFEMTSGKDPATGDPVIHYEYKPNEYLETWFAFTNYSGNKGNNSSYMAISYKQVCR